MVGRLELKKNEASHRSCKLLQKEHIFSRTKARLGSMRWQFVCVVHVVVKTIFRADVLGVEAKVDGMSICLSIDSKRCALINQHGGELWLSKHNQKRYNSISLVI
jgi:hypothetical protein